MPTVPPRECEADHLGRILDGWSPGPRTMPKVVHQQWRTRNESSLPEAMQRWRANCIRLNPGWEFRLYDDADNRLLVGRYAPWFASTYSAYKLPVNRIDAIRFVYLLAFGGLYMDLDYACLRPFDSLLSGHIGNASLALPQLLVGEDSSGSGEIDTAGNSWLGAAAGHPLAHAALCRLIQTRNATTFGSNDPVGQVAGVWFVRGLLKAAADATVDTAGVATIAAARPESLLARRGEAQQRLSAWGAAVVPGVRVCPFGWRHRSTGLAALDVCTNSDDDANRSRCLAMFPQAVTISFHTFTWQPSGLEKVHCWGGRVPSIVGCLRGDGSRFGPHGPLLGMQPGTQAVPRKPKPSRR